MDNYKKIKPQNAPSTDEKLAKMRTIVMDKDRCREIAQKLSAYIKEN